MELLSAYLESTMPEAAQRIVRAWTDNMELKMELLSDTIDVSWEQRAFIINEQEGVIRHAGALRGEARLRIGFHCRADLDTWLFVFDKRRFNLEFSGSVFVGCQVVHNAVSFVYGRKECLYECEVLVDFDQFSLKEKRYMR